MTRPWGDGLVGEHVNERSEVSLGRGGRMSNDEQCPPHADIVCSGRYYFTVSQPIASTTT